MKKLLLLAAAMTLLMLALADMDDATNDAEMTVSGHRGKGKTRIKELEQNLSAMKKRSQSCAEQLFQFKEAAADRRQCRGVDVSKLELVSGARSRVRSGEVTFMHGASCVTSIIPDSERIKRLEELLWKNPNVRTLCLHTTK